MQVITKRSETTECKSVTCQQLEHMSSSQNAEQTVPYSGTGGPGHQLFMLGYGCIWAALATNCSLLDSPGF